MNIGAIHESPLLSFVGPAALAFVMALVVVSYPLDSSDPLEPLIAVFPSAVSRSGNPCSTGRGRSFMVRGAG